MTSPLQALFFMAVTLAPPGAHHVVVSGGTETYCWDRGAGVDGAGTWVYEQATVDPQHVLLTNDVVPRDVSAAQHQVEKCAHRAPGSEFILRFDSAHQLEKNSRGYVYVVRPGSPNQKFYSFSFE